MVRLGHKRPRVGNGRAGFAVPTVLFMLLGAVFGRHGRGRRVGQRSARHGAGTPTRRRRSRSPRRASPRRSSATTAFPTTAINKCVVSSGGTIALAAAGRQAGALPSTGGTSQGTFKYWVAPTPGHLEIVSVGDVERRHQADPGPGGFSLGAGLLLRLRPSSPARPSRSTPTPRSAPTRRPTATSTSRATPGSAATAPSASAGASPRPPTPSTTPTSPAPAPERDPEAADPARGEPGRRRDRERQRAVLHPGPEDRREQGLLDSGDTDAQPELELLAHPGRLRSTASAGSRCRATRRSTSRPGRASRSSSTRPRHAAFRRAPSQLNLSSNSRITATAGGPLERRSLMVGSERSRPRIQLSSNTQVAGACEQNFVIYAPRTDVNFNSNSTYCGALAAKSIHMSSNTKIYSDARRQELRASEHGTALRAERVHRVRRGRANPPGRGVLSDAALRNALRKRVAANDGLHPVELLVVVSISLIVIGGSVTVMTASMKNEPADRGAHRRRPGRTCRDGGPHAGAPPGGDGGVGFRHPALARSRT